MSTNPDDNYDDEKDEDEDEDDSDGDEAGDADGFQRQEDVNRTSTTALPTGLIEVPRRKPLDGRPTRRKFHIINGAQVNSKLILYRPLRLFLENTCILDVLGLAPGRASNQ